MKKTVNMIKIVKILLLSGLICCIAGSVLYLTGAAAGGRKYVQDRADRYGEFYFNMAGLENRVLKKTKVEDSDGAVSINAELDNVDFRIAESADDCYYIEYEVLSRKEEPVSVETDGGVVNIEEREAEFPRVSFGRTDHGYDNKNYIILYVPKGREIEELSVVLGYGDLQIQKANIKKAELSGEYGNFKFSDVSIKSGQAAIEYGDLKCENLYIGGDTELKLEYGDVNVELEDSCVDAVSVRAETGYGDIKIEEGFGGSITKQDFGMSYIKEAKSHECELTVVMSYGDIKIR